MKKIVFSTLLVLLASASVAMATTTWADGGAPDGDGAADIGSTAFRTSAKVTLIADGDTAGYNVVSGHLQGDEQYTSASNDAAINSGTKVKGEPVTDAALPSTYGAGAGGSGT